ncbi:hypothetical protein [Nocardioides daphniae]|uniref:Phage-Barnase-EndoU-ColicinE5/D-RelE like nuclease 2 domain-containing protein n=1 Tax=Nocardioides daphniae TaxID=402297 RepID=A0A4P7UE75_9ACTN|nr:hypothetical protein [Nocardioides daphniae]QCC78426.1 hypothetical protein E2C04_16710 [Nocardioides daphniae]GGD12548.1 hypothetical protein GCM10007231_09410 [Nocardioides daphniae]
MNHGWPPLGLHLNDAGGDFWGYVDKCYQLYYDTVHVQPRPWPVPGQSLNIKRQPVDEKGRCNTFWHLVTEGEIEDERTPSTSRLERVGWPMALISEFNDIYPAAQSSRIRWWKTKRGAEERYAIALEDFSYVVIVADRKTYCLLWTAYPVEYESRRRKLRREFEEFWK